MYIYIYIYIYIYVCIYKYYINVYTTHLDYCINLSDGFYYDPWNPWCGFIQVSNGCDGRCYRYRLRRILRQV